MSRSTLLRFGSLVVLAAAVAVVAFGCGSDSKKNPTGPGGGGTAADVTIGIAGNLGASSYSPASASCTVGQTVAWKNNDSMTHTSTADGAQWNTGNLAPGATSTKITMSTAGTFTYHCAIHAGMTGTLTVNP